MVTVTGKLENTEDTLYDTQQQLGKILKSFSVFQWRVLVRTQRNEVSLEKERARREKEYSEKLLKSESEKRKVCEEFILVGYKLGGLLVRTEKHRQSCEGILVKYKKENLIEIKTNIKLLEKDLESSLQEESSAPH
jgi:hypothetical protein